LVKNLNIAFDGEEYLKLYKEREKTSQKENGGKKISWKKFFLKKVFEE